MSENQYITQQQKIYIPKESNIFSLINRAKFETKKEKNKSITFTLLAITTLIVSSLFIIQ